MHRDLGQWLAALLLVAGASLGSLTAALGGEKVTVSDKSRSVLQSTTLSKGDCAGGCDACSAAAVAGCCERCGGCASCCACPSRLWVQTDYLLWWAKGNLLPPLVTTSPPNTPRPLAGVLGPGGTEIPGQTAILFGGDWVDDNVRQGARLSFGYWLDDCQTRGVEASWLYLGDGANTGNYVAQSLGDLILARPFFNVLLDREDASLAAYPGFVEGELEVSTSSELHSAALLLRRNWRSGCRGRIDWLGGYRYLRFREGLSIQEHLVSTDPSGPFPVGTTLDVLDRFAAENDFHGGEIGLAMGLHHRRCSLDMSAKVALGNVHGALAVDGATTVTPPGDPPVTKAGGLLALPTNMGRRSHDEFAFVPEAGVNLHYDACKCLSFAMGYNFLLLTSALRTGDQIDRVINTSQMTDAGQDGGTLIGPARPAPRLDDTTFWAQGLSVGVELRR